MSVEAIIWVNGFFISASGLTWSLISPMFWGTLLCEDILALTSEHLH